MPKIFILLLIYTAVFGNSQTASQSTCNGEA